MLELNREALVALRKIRVIQILIMRRNVIVAPVVVTVLKDTEVQTILRKILELKRPPVLRHRRVEKVILFGNYDINFSVKSFNDS